MTLTTGHLDSQRLSTSQLDALSDASRLLAYGLRPRARTANDLTYRELVHRAESDPAFLQMVRTVAAGQGLMILHCDPRVGLVLASEDDGPYRMTISEYSTRAGAAGKSHERVLHGLAWLATAVMAFPRPADLDDDSYIGRVSVDGVDAFVREACRLLQETARDAGEEVDTPSSDPGLEQAWRTYQRRSATGKTGDARQLSSSTQGMISKAMKVMTEQGFLNATPDERRSVYTTTPRFQVHVRELVAQRAYRELIEMNIVVVADGNGSLSATGQVPAGFRSPHGSSDSSTDPAPLIEQEQ
jgi:hypothetical protein